MSRQKRRSFTWEYKLAALSRMAAAASIVGLAIELGIERKLLYCRRDQHEDGGSDNDVDGRPSPAMTRRGRTVKILGRWYKIANPFYLCASVCICGSELLSTAFDVRSMVY